MGLPCPQTPADMLEVLDELGDKAALQSWLGQQSLKNLNAIGWFDVIQALPAPYGHFDLIGGVLDAQLQKLTQTHREKVISPMEWQKVWFEWNRWAAIGAADDHLPLIKKILERTKNLSPTVEEIVWNTQRPLRKAYVCPFILACEKKSIKVAQYLTDPSMKPLNDAGLASAMHANCAPLVRHLIPHASPGWLANHATSASVRCNGEIWDVLVEQGNPEEYLPLAVSMGVLNDPHVIQNEADVSCGVSTNKIKPEQIRVLDLIFSRMSVSQLGLLAADFAKSLTRFFRNPDVAAWAPGSSVMLSKHDILAVLSDKISHLDTPSLRKF